MSAVHLITPTRVVVLWLGELAHDREVPGSIPPNFFEDSILFQKVFSVIALPKRMEDKVTSALLRHNCLGTKNLIQLDSMISHLLPKCQ